LTFQVWFVLSFVRPFVRSFGESHDWSVFSESVDFCDSDDPHRVPRIMKQRESIQEYACLGESVDFGPVNSHNNLHLFFLFLFFFFFGFQLVFSFRLFSFHFFSFLVGAKFRVFLSIVANNSNNNNNNIKITHSYHSIKTPKFI